MLSLLLIKASDCWHPPSFQIGVKKFVPTKKGGTNYGKRVVKQSNFNWKDFSWTRFVTGHQQNSLTHYGKGKNSMIEVIVLSHLYIQLEIYNNEAQRSKFTPASQKQCDLLDLF